MAVQRESENSPRPIWRDPVFFLHIPKVAGTSVRHALEGCLYPHEWRRLEDLKAEIGPASVQSMPNGIQFVSGHVPIWYREAFKRRARTLVILRHPVERALSTYRFWKGLPLPPADDVSDEAVLLRTMKDVSLEEFACNEAGVWRGAISNYGTWLLGHHTPWDLSVGFDPSMAPLARERLREIEMIGLTERLPESMQLIAQELGIPYTRPLAALNASSPHHEIDRAPPSIARAIADANEHDLALWDDANCELDARLKRRSNGPRLAPITSEARFSPLAVGDRFELALGQDPLICEGWLPPEKDNFGSWRFAVAPGPAELYVRWPTCNDRLALVIESPFAAENFDYSSLEICVDDQPINQTVVRLHDRIKIFTTALRAGVSPERKITFRYSEPEIADRAHATHANQSAFAVTSIKWMRCPNGDWDVASLIGARLSDKISMLHDQSAQRAAAMRTMEGMIAKKDEYIHSLLQALNKTYEQKPIISDEQAPTS